MRQDPHKIPFLRACVLLLRMVEYERVRMMQTSIERELEKLGMSRRAKGFFYCADAIFLLCREPFLLAKTVYKTVADTHGTRTASVERDVRYAIEKTWETGDWKQIDKLFGYTVCRERGKPTNREFLCRMAEIVRMGEDTEAYL